MAMSDDTQQPATPQSEPVRDDITQPADQLAEKLTNASAGVGDLAKNMDTIVERKLDNAEQKLDTFMKNLDNFLGKF